MGKCWRGTLWPNFRSFRVHFRGTEEILKIVKHGHCIVLGKLICNLGAECFEIATINL